MKHKKLVTIVTTAILAITMLLPVFAPVMAADPSEWYAYKNGVLTSDTYDLYPFDETSLDFGFSKYGEMINYPMDTGIGLGLQYPGYESVGTYDQKLDTSRDPFCNEYINPHLWLNGWILEARYTHRTLRDRKIVTMAMFADMAAYGGEWVVGHPYPFNLAPHGGRKTTGYAETEDIQLLYDGPRKYVALCVTHLYDWEDTNEDDVVDHPDETWPILDVKFTFIFNKVKKQIIILKDVKQIITGKELDSPIDIQFGDREEWDLGPYPDYASYAHFYHQENATCFGPDWHMAPGIMRERIEEDWYNETLGYTQVTVEGSDVYPYAGPIADGSVRVYVNGVFMEEGQDYLVNYDTGVITWLIPIDQYDWVTVVYKLWKYYESDVIVDDLVYGGPDAGVPHLYDVAQIVSEDLKYVGWKAFWPTLSDFTVDGWEKSLMPLIWVNDVEFVPVTQEPDIPFIIGEWDFMLGKDYPMMFRGVEVVGLTDYHDAEDPQMTWTNNTVMDREAKYQLDEIFNPWDLEKAVHKDTRRWVEWTEGPGWTSAHSPVINVLTKDWDQYCVFSERVYDLTADVLLNRWEGEYGFDVSAATGKATITGLDPLHFYKILYSTRPETTETVVFEVTVEINQTGWNWGCNETTIEEWVYSPPAWVDVLGATHDVMVAFDPWTFHLSNNETDWNESWSTSWTYAEEDFKVYREDAYEAFLADVHDPINYNMSGGEITGYSIASIAKLLSASHDLDVTWPMEGETLHVLDLDHTVAFSVSANYNATEDRLVLTYTYTVTVYYNEKLGGRWEHTVIGKDASTVDSAGAALVTAAYKNKQIEIGIAAEDMEEQYIYNRIPWVMRKFGAGYSVEDYYLSPDETAPAQRACIRDDWCHTWAVSSSNMIGVGGPLANLLAYYGNDFTDAFYADPRFTPEDAPWYGDIAALTCWNKNSYASSNATGYAVIATYKDINGTVLFLVWGHWGRDTYYASRFFHEELIYEFQTFDACITSVILEIDYTDPDHPTFDIVEVLGTISEHNEWEEYWQARHFLSDYYQGNYYYWDESSSAWTIVKGGIHDP